MDENKHTKPTIRSDGYSILDLIACAGDPDKFAEFIKQHNPHTISAKLTVASEYGITETAYNPHSDDDPSTD